MSLVRIATAACLLTAGALIGCGDGSGERQAPAAGDNPDAGLEASKKIMQMQPPSPAKAGKKARS